MILICLIAAPALGSPTMRPSGGEELADNKVAEEVATEKEVEVTTAATLDESVEKEALKEVEVEAAEEQKSEESEDLKAEESTDEAEVATEDEDDESSDETTVRPYGSYGSRGSSSFSRGGFGGHRFSNPGFFRNSNFGRSRFGSGNGRSSFVQQSFGFGRF